ncbi:uncharacterized protein ACR2FA_010058 [Aphomia sociella]
MLTTLILLSSMVSINCHVLRKRNVLEETNQDPQTVRYEKQLNIAPYLQNFKPVLRDYVNAHYQRSLDTYELDKITAILEDFLTSLASDLKEVMEQNAEWEVKEINDGIDDERFVEIKTRIMEEFTDIQANTADEMVYRLRKNLLNTRHKLDEIIKDSDRALEEYSSE